MHVCIFILTYEQFICTCSKLLRLLRLLGGAIKALQPNWPAFMLYVHLVCAGMPKYEIKSVTVLCVSRDSSVGTVTRYGLDGPRIESQSGQDFPHSSRWALGPTKPFCTIGIAAEVWCWPLNPI
jgi:hypothetical protein